jgi:hypothetical protein
MTKRVATTRGSSTKKGSHGRQWIFHLLALLQLPFFGQGFATPNKPEATLNNLVSTLQSKLTKKDKVETGPQSILDELDLQSSTEPKTFGFLAKQIPDLVTAAFPVSR